MKPKNQKKLAEVVDFQAQAKRNIARAELHAEIISRARMHVKYDAVLGDLFKKLDALK